MLSNIKDQHHCQWLVLPRHYGLRRHASKYLLLVSPLPDIAVCDRSEVFRNYDRTWVSKQELTVTIDDKSCQITMSTKQCLQLRLNITELINAVQPSQNSLRRVKLFVQRLLIQHLEMMPAEVVKTESSDGEHSRYS